MANQIPALRTCNAGGGVPDDPVIHADSTGGVGSAANVAELSFKFRRTTFEFASDPLLKENTFNEY